jgi:3',5'-cyclic AMP phosphodiesterase CpdA
MNRRDALTALGLAPFAPLAIAAVTAQDPYADGKLVPGPPPLPAADSFSVIVLPDTQHYSERFPATFTAQTQWIVEERIRRRIAAVLHLGDVTNRSSVAEWENASKSLAVLDEAKIPYAFVPGNHDYSTAGACEDRTTKLSEYFPPKRFAGRGHFGGTYDREPERTENSFHLFEASGREFLVIALEFGPRKDVVRWANEVASKHKNREAILITHAFIYHNDTRYDWKTLGTKQSWNPHTYTMAKMTGQDVMDGEELWGNLVSEHENFILTLNGHVLGDGLGRVTTATPGGRDVPQILVNFQMRPNGGDGWLRVLEFKADRSVEAYDYSPTLKQCNFGKENRITFKTAPVKV